MAQPLLMLAHRNGALPQVYRVPGATPSALGDPLPAGIIETGTSLDSSFFANRVIQFQGDIYAVAVNGVYKKDDPTIETGTWTQDHAFTGVVGAGSNFHLHGPYQFIDGGVESLFVLWASTSGASDWNASILNGNTGVWTDVGSQPAVAHGAANPWGKQIVYRGVWYGVTDGGVMTFDPGAQSFGVIGPGASGLSRPERAALCIFNDRLFMLGRNGGTGFAALFEISGGGIVHLLDTAFDEGGGATLSGGINALFPSPDGSVMYGLWYTTTGGTGWVFAKFIDTSGVISFATDLTSLVLPAALRPGGGSGGITNRWWVFYDQETTPGLAKMLLYRAVDGAAGSVISQYSFVDEANEIIQDDSGGVAAWAMTNVMTGGGERIFTPGELHIEIVQRIAVLGGEGVRFKAWGDVGADKKVDFRFNAENEVPLAQATLIGTPTVVSGPAPAPTRNVNTLEGVTADGTTIYQTTWDVTTDGLVSGQRAQLVPRIFV